MNILIIADKKTSKEYTELLRATPNINVLGVVNSINSIDTVKTIRQKYNPLGLLVDTSVRHKGIDISFLIKSLQKVFPQSRILLFASNDEIELFNDFGLYGVIGNTITSIQFNDVIKSFVNNEDIDTSVISQEQTDRYIKRNTKAKTSLVNKKIIPIILITLVIILVIVCFVLKNNDNVDNLSTPDEATITSTSTIPTEEKTTVFSIIETSTSNSDKYVTNNQVIVNTTTIPPSTVPTTTQNITTQQPTTKKVVQKKRKKKSSSSSNSSNNNTDNVPVQTQPPVTKRIVKKKQKTQTQIKIDYGNNNWSNNGKVETSVSLSYYSKTLEVADSVTITATVTPKQKKVHWSSSNTSVATIKQNGYVKAKNVGTATITATADGKSATCTIYVKKRT